MLDDCIKKNWEKPEIKKIAVVSEAVLLNHVTKGDCEESIILEKQGLSPLGECDSY